MRKWISSRAVGAAVALAGTLLAVPGLAHHSFAPFWHMDRMATIEGVVVELRMVNPHPTLKVEVAEANGQKAVWTITARATASALITGGWTAQTLTPGMRVRVQGNPPRREGLDALAAGAITKLADGAVLSFGGTGDIPAGE